MSWYKGNDSCVVILFTCTAYTLAVIDFLQSKGYTVSTRAKDVTITDEMLQYVVQGHNRGAQHVTDGPCIARYGRDNSVHEAFASTVRGTLARVVIVHNCGSPEKREQLRELVTGNGKLSMINMFQSHDAPIRGFYVPRHDDHDQAMTQFLGDPE